MSTRFRLGFGRRRLLESDAVAVFVGVGRRRTISTAHGLDPKAHAQFVGYVLVDRTGVCHFLGHT